MGDSAGRKERWTGFNKAGRVAWGTVTVVGACSSVCGLICKVCPFRSCIANSSWGTGSPVPLVAQPI